MKKIYEIPVKSDKEIRFNGESFSTMLENAKINWITEQEKLKKIELVFGGLELTKNSNGVIIADDPELNEKVYRLAAFISNNILIQNGIDAINYKSVLNSSPDLVGENPEEKAEISSSGIRKHNSLPCHAKITNPINPEDYPNNLNNSEAVALFADAIRVKTPFQKYELLYKIVEFFFPDLRGKALDKKVCNYIKVYDKKYEDENEFTKLRRLRNRCVHSGNNDHVNPEDLASVREIRKVLPQLNDLAKLLLNNPPLN